MRNALQDRAVCPACRGPLHWARREARCAACGGVYAIQDSVPVLLVSDVQDDPVKSSQIAFYEDADGEAEYEIVRPRGTPRLHAWFIADKLRRAVSEIPLAGLHSALVVCGGSGLEAEWLSRQGVTTVCSDLSHSALLRAAQRSERFGAEFDLVVADVEELPFSDGSFDLVLVHDGLHHLVEPLKGLTEMARVAKHAVSINEPALAAVTRAAVRLGAAEETEEAGNRVARLTLPQLSATLEGLGYRVVASERYGMFYRHRPGFASHMLSAPPLFRAARLAWRTGNALGGRFGNKLVVQAVRVEELKV